MKSELSKSVIFLFSNFMQSYIVCIYIHICVYIYTYNIHIYTHLNKHKFNINILHQSRQSCFCVLI